MARVCPFCEATNDPDYRAKGQRPIVYTQTYEPTDKRGKRYIQGRCRACGKSWDIETETEDKL